MKPLSRRDVLKSSLLVPAAVAAQPLKPIEAALPAPLSADASIPASDPSEPGAGRERLLLDFGWRFHFGHACDTSRDFGFGSGRAGNFQKTGNFLPAGSLAFDDTDWTAIGLPHDWAVELPFVNDPALASKGFHPLGRNYPETSVGWYRRVFELDETDRGKRISLEFDGVYREAMVVLNGFYVGRHSGGYDPFRFDVTDFANPGGRNVLLIRVDATSSDGWFYEGAGIYRHVWLVKTNPVHVKQWGTFVRSELKPASAALSIRTELVNDTAEAKNARVVSTILDPDGKEVGKAVTALISMSARGEQELEQQITVSRPRLWSLEERNLYVLITDVRSGGDVVDRYITRFGIRSIKMDSSRGLLLNGSPVKVKGTCNHQDHAGLGVALPDSVQYFRIRKLKEMGCNGLRTSHNPPTPELLNACDELGMLVFAETRMMSSNPEGLAQFENLVRSDRNHPSVFMWSMGNEEATANSERGVGILTAMKAVAYRHDGSRPVSIAPTGAIGTGGLTVCDVIGYNYEDPQAAAYHKAHPDRPVIGTETVSAVGTRGIYITDPSKGFVSSYDPYTTTGRASAEGWWRFCDSQDWLAGGFVWTGFDYRGEPSPNGWPNISSQYGVIDTCGFPKDTFFYYQSWWTQSPVLHIFPHWNWPGYEGKKIAVWVHSNLDKVELLLNGQRLGMQDVQKNHHLAWNVVYAPGTLEARGYKDGKLVFTKIRETTSAPAQIALSADRMEIAANGEDVAMFTVEVRDAKGRVVPITENEIAFKIRGEGKLIGTGNGDPTDQSPDKGTSRRAFGGLCMAIVQSTKTAGTITLEASSPGLAPVTLAINAKEAALRPHVSEWERKIPEGGGANGLWRPEHDSVAEILVLSQQGAQLTGSADGFGSSWAGGNDSASPIEDGSMSGDRVTFRIGGTIYTGTVDNDRMELARSSRSDQRSRPNPLELADKTLAIGPAPDGSDPSRGPNPRPQPAQQLVLRRVTR
ncbi:beta-galactosidase [Edaphobacter acidisoli]|uniref:Beta-galactosidase n=1 Tax=Edaphobacter acidisoli TaxID=2040573 RepID=A0A916RQ00_9BACT|nr:beta-galactosidase GalA [Edaphobacter acidisoli]GGA64006.1 beta-galactosidase [Edaphobacter acidisoli]